MTVGKRGSEKRLWIIVEARDRILITWPQRINVHHLRAMRTKWGQGFLRITITDVTASERDRSADPLSVLALISLSKAHCYIVVYK